MAVAWGALSSAPQPGCLGHGHYASSWATMQGLHLQQMMFTSKGEAVLAGAAASQQSNARIAKSNRRSRYGEALPTFGFDDEMEGGSTLLSQLLSDELEIVEQEKRDMEATTKKAQRKLKNLGIEFKRAEKSAPAVPRKVKLVSPSALDDFSSDVATTSSSRLSRAGTSGRNVLQDSPVLSRSKSLNRNEWEEQAYQIIRRQKLRDAALRERAEKASKVSSKKSALSERLSESITATTLADEINDVEDALVKLSCEINLEPKFRPLLQYLHQQGLSESDFRKIAERHKTCLQTNAVMAKERVEYLLSIGVESENLSKLIVRHPQILEYTVERAMKPRIQYLKRLGVPESKLGRVITVSPSLLECSLHRSLKPRVEYLKDVVGIKDSDIGLIVTRSPQVLTQSIEDSLEPRVEFFMVEMGVTKEKLAKMVTRHPQLLHYSVEDGICPRVDYLRSIGLSREDILKVFARLTQILSLSIENCLKPKYEYLVKELKGGPQTVTSFPAYFSLSLEQRIKPRHRFLATLNRLPSGPFPMKSLAVTDSCFCKQWAKTSLEEYQLFRNELHLGNFAKNFEWKNKVHI
ncbi:hypothetical protein M758_3G108800 [Ceratodon purpureus]|nr:hypothetical protein M758_3G108800 [Ceratodon purpureus]